MKFLILFLISCSTFAGIQEQKNTFNEIIDGQGVALDRMSEKENLVGGFHMTDMITDIGISKSGVLGLSALKSSNSIELRWKRKAAVMKSSPAEMLVPAETDSEDLVSLTETIASLAEKSGKVSNVQKEEIKKALVLVNDRINSIQFTRLNGWKLSAVRLDLNFSASGSVSFLATAGATFRVRLEWQVKNKPFVSAPQLTDETKTIVKVLSDINQSSRHVIIPGFEIKRLMLGFGTSMKKKLGIWKYTGGFVGALIFVPVPVPPGLVSVPAEIDNLKLEVNGFEEEVTAEKWRLPWRRTYAVPVDFRKGLAQSVGLASAFIEQTNKKNFKYWYISDVRTVNDISKTGAFGLADVTTKGFLEIEHKRINP